MTDTNKMREENREQFEAWARKMSMDLEYRNIPGVGQFYVCPRTLLAQEAWQASRQAVVVELPERCEYADPQGEYAKGHRIGKRDVVAAIEAQGLLAEVRT